MTLPVLWVLLAASLLAAQPSAVPAGEVGPAFGAGKSSSADSVVAQAPELCDSSGVTQFNDVGSGDYGASYILCMRALGLSVGTGGGEFGAEGVLTRGQMASFLVRLWREVLGRSCPGGGTPFGDVAGNTHEDNIACLYNLGIAKGTTATTYGPGETLKASQISRFLLRTYEKAGNRCPDRASELDEAADCLLSLRVVPDAAEARSSIAVTRARMAVYVVGLWHNLSGRGLPPEPPRQRLRDAMLPIPADLATQANVVTTGRMEIPVYICAPANRYRVAHLRTAVADLNREVSSFFAEQSSGEVDLRFTVGGIVSPAIDWGATNFETIYDTASQHPCINAATGQEGHLQVVILTDVRMVGYAGFAWVGLGPAVQPMKHQFSSEVSYYDTVAHEVGHSRFGFCHTHEKYAGENALQCPSSDFHNANVYDPNDRSVMSYSDTGNLDTSHVSCAHRAQAGWPAGPPLPGGQRCTGSGTGPQSTSVPNRPPNLSVTPGDGQLIVRWEVPDPPDGETWQWLSGYTVSFDNGQGDSGQRNVANTWVIIAGLTNGAEYTIEVTANNEIGAGPPAVTRATPGGDTTGVPGPPTNAAVVEGDRELTISWSAPSDDGGAPITGYTITSDDGSIDVTVGAGVRSRSIGGLTNGRRYTISVYAQNRNGMSQTPATVTATPIATQQVPDAPVVTAFSEVNQIEAQWSTADNGSPILQWEVRIDGANILETFAADEFVWGWSSLSPGTYRVSVRALNSAGWSEWGFSNTVTTIEQPAIPPPPSSVWLADVGETWVTVAWDPVPGAFDYDVDYWGGDIDSWGGFETDVTSGSYTTTYQATGLHPNKTYTFAVRSCNDLQQHGDYDELACGTVWTEIQVTTDAQVQVPDAPVVTAYLDVTGSDGIEASWSVNDNGSPIRQWEVSIDGANILDTFRADDWPEFEVEFAAGEFSWGWGLTPGTYRVSVRALNSAGWSEWGYSNWVTIELLPPLIPDVTVSISGNRATANRVTVHWSVPDDGSIDKWEFWIGLLESGTGTPRTYNKDSAACTWDRTWGRTSCELAWILNTPGTYQALVRAHNAAGWSEWGYSDWFTIDEQIYTPTAPYVNVEVSDNRATAYLSVPDYVYPDDGSIDKLEVRIDGTNIQDTYTTATYCTWFEGIFIACQDSWTLSPGTYRVRARAHNAAGWSEWGYGDWFTVESPTAILSRGDTGPTVAPRQGDVPCSRSSPDCRWLNIELKNFTPGRYRIYCAHDGFDSYSAGYDIGKTLCLP